MKVIQGIILLVMIFTAVDLTADDDNERARELLLKGDIISLDSLLPSIREHGDWQILEIELEQHDENVFYEVELLDEQGRVHKLKFDARTGQEMMAKQDGEKQ